MKGVEQICPTCGNTFIPNSHNQKYCSPRCGRASEKAKRIPAIRLHGQLRQRIDKNLFAAYHGECAVCHWWIPEWMGCYKKKETLHGLNYHHIIPIAEGGTSENENVVLLCPNCHKMAHAGLIPIDDLKKRTIPKEKAKELADEWNFERDKRRAELIDKLIS